MNSEGAIKLSEAVKSNSSLTALALSSNILVASFHSHSIQIVALVVKEQSNYLKHSNQTPLSLYLISTVVNLLLHFILTQYSK
jgi:ABC-type polysaccharide/polyol phosphate export permease